MYTTQWTFFVNPLLGATRDSYQNAMAISTFHDDALSGMQNDPFFGPLYTLYHPIHLAFKQVYDAYDAQGNVQTGQTLNFAQLIKALASVKIKAWDIAIQNIYAQGTTPYKTIMPHNRVPFQSGKQSEKLQAVTTLSTALAGIPALASVKADVDAFWQLLDTAFRSKNTGKSTTFQYSAAVDAQRIIMCTAQYANLGAMINKFPAATDNLDIYFDLATIRSASQASFTGHLKPLAKHCIFKHTFAATDEILLINAGNGQLNYYLGLTKTAVPVTGSVVITLAPNTEQTIAASALGDFANNLYLIVANPDANLTAAWEVDLE